MDPWGARKSGSFIKLIRLVMGDSLGYFGYQDGELARWGVQHNWFSERQAFMLGAKFDAGWHLCAKATQDPSDCFLRKVHKLRSSLDWWPRRFSYLDTIGVTNEHVGLIDVRRFDDTDNKTVLLVDNFRNITGLSVSFGGQAYKVSPDMISAIQVQGESLEIARQTRKTGKKPAGGVGLKMDDDDSELVLPLPMLGWSTWESFGCFINSTLLEESIRAMAASTLKAAGYNWILIDDCWTTCKGKVAANGMCSDPGDRDAAGRPVPDPIKFPHGFKPLTALAHSLGLRIGIYTSVSAATCAGYTGAFQHEATDAAAFVEWGFDSVKHDSCGRDYSVHDGSFQAAVSRMRDGIWNASQVRSPFSVILFALK
jgi:hypothetical protein